MRIKMTEEKREALCDLTVQADACSTEFISYAHALYHYSEELRDFQVYTAIDTIRENLNKLERIVEKVERLFGRPLVARNHDELTAQLRATIVREARQFGGVS